LSAKSKKLLKGNKRNTKRFVAVMKSYRESDDAFKAVFVKKLTDSWYNDFRNMTRSDLRYILKK